MVPEFQSYKIISLFNFITTLPKSNIYLKKWLFLHIFIWWGDKKTIYLLFLLAGHDEEQNFMTKLGVILPRIGVCKCCVGEYCDSLLLSGKLSKREALPAELCDYFDKFPNKNFQNVRMLTGAALGFALEERQQLISKLPPGRGCTCRHQSRAWLGRHRLTHLCSLS